MNLYLGIKNIQNHKKKKKITSSIETVPRNLRDLWPGERCLKALMDSKGSGQESFFIQFSFWSEKLVKYVHTSKTLLGHLMKLYRKGSGYDLFPRFWKIIISDCSEKFIVQDL